MKKMLLTICLVVSCSVAFPHSGPEVPEPLSLEDFANVFGFDLVDPEITVETIGNNLSVLFGAGGNIAVSTGKDGVLIVDDQFPSAMPKIEAAIAGLGGDAIDFVINTHWHFDHAEGNLALGPKGSWLVSHANSRSMMLDDHLINLVGISYLQKAYPEAALPTLTFDTTMQFHLNGEQVDLFHFGPAHTTGDTAIIFRGSNAVHLGDVFNNVGYPFIDAGNGGTLDGVIRFCSETLKLIDADTVVIPGHGPITDYSALKAYIDMLTTIRDRMMDLIENGATLEDVVAAKLTKEWDEKNGDNTGFINRSYMSLTHKIVDR
ncbi:MAG: MBL fold metallo-hydrolase [Gammaproteobacteria bacterium]|jgi:glyoxylase-like metal-dependent hydrolase (beta-lactamase superfamily II)|nr:MBL fold metallo-hydrolase [Gammaproteobacteria bacterium]